MLSQIPQQRWLYSRLALGLVFVLLMLAGLTCCGDTAQAQSGTAPADTIPPYQSLTKTAVHAALTVTAGSDITYTVAFVRAATNYTVTLGITDTVPHPLALVPGSVNAIPAGTAVVQGQAITWTAIFPPSLASEPVTITYVARSPECNPATQSVSNVVMLQEMVNSTMITPTSVFSQASATVPLALTPCEVRLPLIKYEVLPPFPQLVNGDLEQGPTSGWQQVVDGKNEALIFPRSAIPSDVLRENGSAFIGWLGGIKDSTNTMEQPVTIPANYRVYLSLRYYTASEENDCNADTAVLFAGNTKLKSYGLCNSQESKRWRRDRIDLSSFRGSSFPIRLQTVLNGQRNSNWFVDDFLLCSDDAGVPAGTPRCPD